MIHNHISLTLEVIWKILTGFFFNWEFLIIALIFAAGFGVYCYLEGQTNPR